MNSMTINSNTIITLYNSNTIIQVCKAIYFDFICRCILGCRETRVDFYRSTVKNV